VHDASAVDKCNCLKQVSDELFGLLLWVELLLLDAVIEFSALAELQDKTNGVREALIHVYELDDGGMVAQDTQDIDLLIDARQGLVVIRTSANYLQCIPLLWLIPAPAKVNNGELARTNVIGFVNFILFIKGVISVEHICGTQGDGVSHDAA